MEKAWKFIYDAGITDDAEKHQADQNLILVENVHRVRDAYCKDLEADHHAEDEDVYGFLNRHGIKWGE